MTTVGTILNLIAVVLLLSGFSSHTIPAIMRQALAGMVFIAAAFAWQVGGSSGTWTAYVASVGAFLVVGARYRQFMADGYRR